MFLNCSDEKYTFGYGVASIIEYLPEGKRSEERILAMNSHAYFFTRYDCYPHHFRCLQEAGFQVKYSHINTGQDFFCLRAGLLGYYCI